VTVNPAPGRPVCNCPRATIVDAIVDEEAPNGGAEPDTSGDAPNTDTAAASKSEAPPPLSPLEEAKLEAAKFKDQLLRTAADFDNFRKRARKDQVDAEKKGREDILKELLPVFDNLERAIMHAEKATDVQSVAEGIRMVIRQFGDTLGKIGIERIASVGLPFDPALHEAIQQLESTEYPPGTVAAEIQGGYRTQDRLIRPALVVVAKAPSNGGGAAS
jgi:molecular chaperone GrpE